MDRLNVDALSGSAMGMKSCEIALEQINHAADLSCLDTTGQIVKQIPYIMQTNWADNAERLTQNGEEPSWYQQRPEYLAVVFGSWRRGVRGTSGLMRARKRQKSVSPVRATAQAS